MEENETNNTPAEKKQDSSGCSCGCGGQKSNKAVIILWGVVLIGIAVFGVYSRMNADPYRSEADKILKHAYTLYEQEKFEESADCLRQAAELGQPWAQLYYGGTLKKGVGVEQNPTAAVEWFRKSADQNCAIAFFELGVCYENGEGVAQDLNEAEAWYRKALDAGIGEEAQAALDRVEQLKAEATPEAEAERLLIKAQELFDRRDKDVECAELLRQSAELGNAWAQVSYGRFLCKGIGTALDPALAVEWFRKSADQGCPDAFYALGICYENGEGVVQDFDEAIKWYRKAVDTDIPEAQSAIIRVEKAKALKAAEK